MFKFFIILFLQKINDKFMRQYHFSYDTIDCDTHFEDYKEAKKYLLCVIANTPIRTIQSFNESTFILEFNKHDGGKLITYLNTNLSAYFYFTISLISVNNKKQHYVFSNKNNRLNDSLQDEWQNLSCENLEKSITEY